MFAIVNAIPCDDGILATNINLDWRQLADGLVVGKLAEVTRSHKKKPFKMMASSIPQYEDGDGAWKSGEGNANGNGGRNANRSRAKFIQVSVVGWDAVIDVRLRISCIREFVIVLHVLHPYISSTDVFSTN